MRKTRILVLSLAILGITATAGSAFAWFGGKGDRHARIKSFIEWRISQVLESIDATKDQRARIDAIKARMFAVGAEHAKSRPEVRAEFLEQWEAETPDARRVHQLVDDRMDEIRAMAHQAADAALEVHGTLTAKQRAEIGALIAERMAR